MKRFISLLLVLSMLLTFPGMAYAADATSDDYGLSAVGATGRPVLLEVYSTDSAQVSLYSSGDMRFAITVIDDGRIELAFSEEEGVVYSLWFTAEDLQGTATATCFSQGQVTDDSFVDAVIEYGKNNVEKSTQIQAHEEYISEQQLEASAPTSDRELLLSQLEDMYGPIHIDYNWTGRSSVNYDGKTFYFKENLDYYVSAAYVKSTSFSANISLGSLVAGLIHGASMQTIATVLGVTSLIDTIIPRKVTILRYSASVLYTRYVLVNGKGPYDECSRSVEYWGWAEAGSYYTAQLQECGGLYTPTELIFNSYTMQRDRANANYF